MIFNVFFNYFLYFLFFLNVFIDWVFFLQANILWTYITWISLPPIFTCRFWSCRLISLLFLHFTALIQMLDQIFIFLSLFLIQPCQLLLFSICLTQLCLVHFILVLKFIYFRLQLIDFRVLKFRLFRSSWARSRVRRARPYFSFILLVRK